MIRVLYILLICLSLAGCKSTKRIVESETRTKDSSRVDSNSSSKDSAYIYKERVVRDTIIKVERRTVRDTIRLKDLETSTTQSGKVLPGYFEKHEDGVKAFVTVMPDGSFIYGCEADSLLYVVQGLTREYEYQRHVSDSLKTVMRNQTRTETSFYSEFVTKTKPWWPYVLIVVLCAVIILAMIWLIKKFG